MTSRSHVRYKEPFCQEKWQRGDSQRGVTRRTASQVKSSCNTLVGVERSTQSLSCEAQCRSSRKKYIADRDPCMTQPFMCSRAHAEEFDGVVRSTP